MIKTNNIVAFALFIVYSGAKSETITKYSSTKTVK